MGCWLMLTMVAKSVDGRKQTEWQIWYVPAECYTRIMEQIYLHCLFVVFLCTILLFATQGQGFAAIDPEAFAPNFADRMQDFMDDLRGQNPVSSSNSTCIASTLCMEYFVQYSIIVKCIVNVLTGKIFTVYDHLIWIGLRNAGIK